MNATLTVNGISLPLGGAAMESIFYELMAMNDGVVVPGWESLLMFYSQHPDPAIRSLVCQAEGVPLDALERLIVDEDIVVIRALIEDSSCRKLLREDDRKKLGLENCEQVLSFIGEEHVKRWLSWPCSQLHLAMAENAHKFGADCAWLIVDTLVHHPSYKVRDVLARDGGHSVDHELLARDEDPGVRLNAIATLACLAEIEASWDKDPSEDEDED